ncbi:MAG: hypothetical protein LIO81_05455 [Clostridiales bacterium]|nr:hypothetical protein [Clostridiales bacterium]
MITKGRPKGSKNTVPRKSRIDMDMVMAIWDDYQTLSTKQCAAKWGKSPRTVARYVAIAREVIGDDGHNET